MPFLQREIQHLPKKHTTGDFRPVAADLTNYQYFRTFYLQLSRQVLITETKWTCRSDTIGSRSGLVRQVGTARWANGMVSCNAGGYIRQIGCRLAAIINL